MLGSIRLAVFGVDAGTLRVRPGGFGAEAAGAALPPLVSGALGLSDDVLADTRLASAPVPDVVVKPVVMLAAGVAVAVVPVSAAGASSTETFLKTGDKPGTPGRTVSLINPKVIR